MARNSERALLILNRWHTMRHVIQGGETLQIPNDPRSVYKLDLAEAYRNKISRDLITHLIKIQDTSLSEKELWSKRIKELGGVYVKYYNPLENDFVIAKDGTHWYGASKFLPRVEIDESHETNEREEIDLDTLAKNVNEDYFGANDFLYFPDLSTLPKS
uniref:Pre-mRNA-splicing factor ISY1-like n=1 Tax=Dermatophagoides pteronyssinus TaxID=6956 RepID=A0A6P6YB48_DERPT|nr:pre-mRNA-splicing factor ISY1-like [Dermatophagoides pteronyssinus]